jgi:hypothetical protein
LVIMVSARRTNRAVSPWGTACPGCRLHEVHLGLIRLVVNELIAGGAVPADLEGSAAGEVTRGVGLVGVPAPPVGEQAERPGEFGAFGGELVGGAGRSLGVGPGYQQPIAFKPPEAVGQDVRGDARDRVYEWVDLNDPDSRLDPARVGAVVAAIHRLSATDLSPLDPWYHEPVGADRWDHLAGQLLAAGAPFASRLADLRDELVALESWIEPPEMIRTCHRDLWADNVVPTADGGVCVIDWENSGPADPSQELGCVLFEFARADPGRLRALTGAYRQAGGPAAVTRRGHFSMLIAQLGHITENAATDWLQPSPRSPKRADSAAWIGEVLQEPHTRELLETILEAV